MSSAKERVKSELLKGKAISVVGSEETKTALSDGLFTVNLGSSL